MKYLRLYEGFLFDKGRYEPKKELLEIISDDSDQLIYNRSQYRKMTLFHPEIKEEFSSLEKDKLKRLFKSLKSIIPFEITFNIKENRIRIITKIRGVNKGESEYNGHSYGFFYYEHANIEINIVKTDDYFFTETTIKDMKEDSYKKKFEKTYSRCYYHKHDQLSNLLKFIKNIYTISSKFLVNKGDNK